MELCFRALNLMNNINYLVKCETNIEYQETMYQHHESTYWNFKLLYIAWYADISNHIAHNGCRGVKGIDTAQLSSAEPHPRFCTSSNNVCNVSDVCNSKNLSQWFWLRIRLHVFPRHLVSTSTFEFLYKKKKGKAVSTDHCNFYWCWNLRENLG